ncbi:MAG: hypothetical protein NC114_09905 [Ruminococcus flavefaciens]|nr:hypothetical protein [Ruminococcus flavefaciens]
MLNVGKKDLSYRVGYSGNAIVASGGEVICNSFHRLLYMIPGEDDYNKEMGLDVTTRSKRPYSENERDTEYEAMIVKQLYEYTDIIPLTVVAVYQNQLLVIMMDCMYDNKEYRLQASSDPNRLATKIEPKVVGYQNT